MRVCSKQINNWSEEEQLDEEATSDTAIHPSIHQEYEYVYKSCCFMRWVLYSTICDPSDEEDQQQQQQRINTGGEKLTWIGSRFKWPPRPVDK